MAVRRSGVLSGAALVLVAHGLMPPDAAAQGSTSQNSASQSSPSQSSPNQGAASPGTASQGAASQSAAPELTQADATGVLSRMVLDSDGKEIGRIVDVVVDPAGQPRAIVVDVGGFMGVGARRVAVSWPSVHVPPPGAADKHVAIDLTDAQVRAAPDYTDRSKPAVIVGLPAAPDPAASDTPNDTPKQPDAPK